MLVSPAGSATHNRDDGGCRVVWVWWDAPSLAPPADLLRRNKEPNPFLLCHSVAFEPLAMAELRMNYGA